MRKVLCELLLPETFQLAMQVESVCLLLLFLIQSGDRRPWKRSFQLLMPLPERSVCQYVSVHILTAKAEIFHRFKRERESEQINVSLVTAIEAILENYFMQLLHYPFVIHAFRYKNNIFFL